MYIHFLYSPYTFKILIENQKTFQIGIIILYFYLTYVFFSQFFYISLITYFLLLNLLFL